MRSCGRAEELDAVLPFDRLAELLTMTTSPHLRVSPAKAWATTRSGRLPRISAVSRAGASWRPAPPRPDPGIAAHKFVALPLGSGEARRASCSWHAGRYRGRITCRAPAQSLRSPRHSAAADLVIYSHTLAGPGRLRTLAEIHPAACDPRWRPARGSARAEGSHWRHTRKIP